MKKIITLVVYLTGVFNLYAQPGDERQFIHESAYTQPFLHCVTDEKYFAKYAVEVHNGHYELMEPIQCKLHIPSGLNKIWQDAEESKSKNKGDYDYSEDLRIGVRFNFYVGGELVSTAIKKIEKSREEDLYTFYFNLDPLNFKSGVGEINHAYIELLKKMKSKGSQIAIQAALAARNLDRKSDVPIVSGVFYLRYDDRKYTEWMNVYSKAGGLSPMQIQGTEQLGENEIVENFNIQLKHVADSSMKSIFGEKGFSRNFRMTCFKNPCAKGYMYANTMESDHPCLFLPQDSCKEAIVTYNYVKEDVPLIIKMLVTLKENGVYVYIEDNQYGKNKVNIEKQNLLSVSEIRDIMSRQFPNDGLVILNESRGLVYSRTRIRQPYRKNDGSKLDRDPGYRIIKETKAGKEWKGGFVYTAASTNPRTRQRAYQFDAVTGDILWITEVYNVTTDKQKD